MKKSKWPPEKTGLLRALVDEGLARREIALRMGLVIHAVTTKLFTLGLTVPLNPPGYTPPKASRASADHLAHLARFPRFEDVTPSEARAIAAGTKPSARFSKSHDISLIGNAGRMCAP